MVCASRNDATRIAREHNITTCVIGANQYGGSVLIWDHYASMVYAGSLEAECHKKDREIRALERENQRHLLAIDELQFSIRQKDLLIMELNSEDADT